MKPKFRLTLLSIALVFAFTAAGADPEPMSGGCVAVCSNGSIGMWPSSSADACDLQCAVACGLAGQGTSTCTYTS